MDIFRRTKRLVIKVGTSTLTHVTGKLDLMLIEKLTREIADLHNGGKEIVLVSSGAVGAGMGYLGLTERPQTIPEKQAVAAVGQVLLMQMYTKMFSEYGKVTAQVLLTREDIMNRRRYLNARNTLTNLLQYNVIPIVNENDTVAIEEINFGDNDTLSALVADLIDADGVIILTDTEGLFTQDPHLNKDARLIKVVEKIDHEVEQLAGGTVNRAGTGGMRSKIEAAKIATTGGIPLVIAHGRKENVLRRLNQGEQIGTLFLPREHCLSKRKHWIAFGHSIQGIVMVDDGAKNAISKQGKSLLPTGVITVEGSFDSGDLVSITDNFGQEFARGLVSYSAADIKQIKGKHSTEIEEILGYFYGDEVIHRDNLVNLTDES